LRIPALPWLGAVDGRGLYPRRELYPPDEPKVRSPELGVCHPPPVRLAPPPLTFPPPDDLTCARGVVFDLLDSLSDRWTRSALASASFARLAASFAFRSADSAV
jgi:hypothetical protein